MGDLLDAVGDRGFAPMLLIPGLIMAAPGPADIPGVPVVLGLWVIVVAAQLLVRRDHVWMPSWLERRKLKRHRIIKMVSWLRRPAAFVDHYTKRRYPQMVHHAGLTTIAVACILIAAATPVLEFVPFSANLAGAAIVAFSLALLARDGLLAAVAIAVSLAVVLMVGYQFIG